MTVRNGLICSEPEGVTSFHTTSRTGFQSPIWDDRGRIAAFEPLREAVDGTVSESNPDLRGGRARPGDRGDRRAQCRSARESWPAGLRDAVKDDGSSRSSGFDADAGGETRPLQGIAGTWEGEGARPQPRPPRSGQPRGVRRGRRSPPLARARTFYIAQAGSGTLACLSQPADGLRHASPGTARNSARQAVAGKLLGLLAAIPRTAMAVTLWRRRRSIPRARVPPYPYP